ncbi:MAG: hydantoinase/oxoprolinase family protein [Acidimicrobiia bacterium]|nr:hydantoinase/oxoprolinase family protein [Acidimicrobiia bacterium]
MPVTDDATTYTAEGEVELRNTISIDIGGTFTDCFVAYDRRTASGKAPTTRHRLAVGFNQAIADCADKLGVDPGDLVARTDMVRYATTLAMNALIERKGPRLGLITTAGFEDTIFIGRGAQWHDGTPVELKRLTARGRRPEPVIPRSMVVGLRERIDDDGDEIIPVDVDEVREKVRLLVDRRAMGFVVALLQSHRDPSHERTVRDVIADEFPDTYLGSQPVLLSSEVLPKQNEYQRDMTAILAAYLHRTMAEELTELGNELHEHGYKRPLFIVNSGGGVNPLQRTSAVETYNAGPVAGVIGGAHVADLYGIDNIILTDMGGTSFDIGTVVEAGSRVDEFRGRHFYSHIPMIDRFRVGISMIETKSIGAGGGSIARYDDLLNLVEVGPQSAGSNPGPACFDLGGEQPTVTDADVVLGYVNPEWFLGGRMQLNPEAAAEAVRTHLAEPLGVSVEEAAFLVKTLIDAKMGNEVFKETNLKGYDPRDFVLFAFGGAGPTHACGYGTYVDARAVMTFPVASVFSAFGIANTDFVRSYEQSRPLKLYEAHSDHWLDDYDAYNDVVAGLQAEALRDAGELGARHITWGLELELRYGLQPHVTRIRSPRLALAGPEDVRAVYDAFEGEYGRIYSPSATFIEGGVEVVGFTLWSLVRTQKLDLPVHPLEGADPSAAAKGRRPTFWGPERGWLDTALFDLDLLKPGNVVAGPAVVEALDTTIVVDPDRTFRIDERASGVVELKA